MHRIQSPRRGWRGRAGAVLVGSALAGAALVSTASPAGAAGGVTITEVAPWASGNSPYAADWFEVTNGTGAPLDVTGWKVDDNSNLFANSVTLAGVTIIPAGGSAIFLESAVPATTGPLFISTWFGASPPSGLQVGTYSGAGVGLGTAGDAVNLYDGSGALRANVTFGASPTVAPFASFDNAAGIDNAAITTLSAPGVNGAFAITPAPATAAVGSPGTIVNSPTPTTTSSTSTTVAPTTTTTAASGTPWPGDQAVQNASTFVFGGNMSGLIEEGTGATPGVLWGARNGPGALFRMVWDGTKWVPDAANDWANGKLLRYIDGTGDVDAEGVTFPGPNSSGGLFVASERNNLNNTVSRLAILRFDPAAPGTTLTATGQWELTADLPAVGPNLGLEAITWVPDIYLVGGGFYDEHLAHPYNPADYPNHGSGLFLVGVEGTGAVHAYALDLSGTGFTRVATFASGFPGVMELQFDRDLNELWAVCDNTCNGRHTLMRINGTGRFAAAATFARPTGMANLNNEGFSIAGAAQCSNNLKPVNWADDSETGGVAIRRGMLSCTAFVAPPDPIVPEVPWAPLSVLAALGVLGTIVFSRRRQLTV
ncbi:MAG: lamin tail domain-containing protein [Acidimicrobiales bacterium]